MYEQDLAYYTVYEDNLRQTYNYVKTVLAADLYLCKCVTNIANTMGEVGAFW